VIAHIVLLQPRPDLTEAQRRAALETLQRAAARCRRSAASVSGAA
jgi:hypothetical protein